MAFDYATNFSNGTMVNSLGTMLQYGNYVTDGWLAYGFLLIVFLIGFLGSALMNVKKALTSASFITFIFAVYFLRIGLVNPALIFILVALIIAGAIGTKAESGSY